MTRTLRVLTIFVCLCSFFTSKRRPPTTKAACLHIVSLPSHSPSQECVPVNSGWCVCVWRSQGQRSPPQNRVQAVSRSSGVTRQAFREQLRHSKRERKSGFRERVPTIWYMGVVPITVSGSGSCAAIKSKSE